MHRRYVNMQYRWVLEAKHTLTKERGSILDHGDFVMDRVLVFADVADISPVRVVDTAARKYAREQAERYLRSRGVRWKSPKWTAWRDDFLFKDAVCRTLLMNGKRTCILRLAVKEVE